MSNNTILGALERMGYAGRMTGHGFRGVASTILHEHGFPHHVIELQLAHMERKSVSSAYNHATHLRERREMMDYWADHLDTLRKATPGKGPGPSVPAKGTRGRKRQGS
jgi:integrase